MPNENKKGSDVQKNLDKVEGAVSKQAEKLPALPSDTKKAVAKAYPWLAGLAGLVGLFWAKDTWNAIRAISALEELSGAFGDFTGSLVNSTFNTTLGYVVLVLLLLAVGLTVAAFAKGALQSSKASWKYFFYAAVTTVAAGIFMFLTSGLLQNRGLLTVIAGLIGVYLLTQIKSEYKA